jgi:hypothetical protein
VGASACRPITTLLWPCLTARIQHTRGQPNEALGRSCGGFGTKIHLAVDGLGNPVEFTLTAGQESDIGQAEALIGGHEPGAVIADKGTIVRGW